jgi:dehydratase
MGKRARFVATALIATGLLASGTAAADTAKTTTTVPYLCRTLMDGTWVPINGHQRSYDSVAPTSAKIGQSFSVTVDPAPSTTNPAYIKTIKDVEVAFALPDNAVLVTYQLSGGSGLGDAPPRVKVTGKQLIVTAPGPIAGGTTYDMPAVTLVLRAPKTGTVTTAPGGTSFVKPGFSFSRQVVGEDTWGPLQCYPDPAHPVVFTTTTVKSTAD